MSAFNPWTGPNFKKPGGKTKLTLKRRADKRDVDNEELKEKRKVRVRDRHCRFPRCGCGRARLPLEVSHSKHKGTNALETKRQLSIAPLMVLLCKWRHQDAPVSIHRHGLRHRFLSRDKFNGPIAWEIDVSIFSTRASLHPPAEKWREIARESAINVWLPPTPWQEEMLERLSTMEV